MDKSKVREIVGENIDRLLWMLQIQDWQINITYEPEHDEGCKATCSRRISYRSAAINIDPNKAESEKDVLDSLLHELLHVLIAEFDLFCECVDENDVARRVWIHATEQTVFRLERMFEYGLKLESKEKEFFEMPDGRKLELKPLSEIKKEAAK